MASNDSRCSIDTERALSPVIGVVLLVGIIIIAMAAVAIFIHLSLPTFTDDREVARFAVDYNNSNNSIDITHTGGKALYGRRVFVEDEEGDRVNWSAVHPDEANVKVGVTIRVGDQTRFDELTRPCTVSPGYEFLVVRYTRDGRRDVLKTHTMGDRTCT
jgi:flagellin-like protein